MKHIYMVSALVKGMRKNEKFSAYTEKQARYFFCKKHGFAVLDIYAYLYDRVEMNLFEEEK